tara:strand:- start:8537 stop:9637 length:1101 start_codon:yes stop_codon:yes gene_type:complete
MKNIINLWNVDFNKKYIIKKLNYAFNNRNLSQGKITKEFENKLSKVVKLPYAICTNSGSSALLLLLITLNLKKNDEIIIPDRTWISDLHAPQILGLKVKLVDVEKQRPIIDIKDLKKKITKKTKVIIAVHLGGRIVNINAIKKITKNYNVKIIEDTSQAFGATNNNYGIGKNSLASFFSFSVAKIVSSAQGGFIATKNKSLYNKLILNRSHAVRIKNDHEKWTNVAFNFKFTDIQACLGIGELKKLTEKKNKLKNIYNLYAKGINKLKLIKIIPVNINNGEIPLYIEIVCKFRKKLHKFLKKKNISSRPFYPSISEAKYNKSVGKFKKSIYFSQNGLYLPSGPNIKKNSVIRVVKALQEFEKEFIK